jgi:hypothetical protein
MISMCRVIHFELQSRAAATPSLLSMSCSEELSLRRRFDPSLKPSRNDGVNGAPNGISVPRRSLSKPHLKGSRTWASLSRNYRLTRAPSSTWRRRDASETLYEGLGRRNQGNLGGCRFADSLASESVRAIARPTMITGKPEDRRPSLTCEPGDLPSLVQPTSGEVTDGLSPSP